MRELYSFSGQLSDEPCVAYHAYYLAQSLTQDWSRELAATAVVVSSKLYSDYPAEILDAKVRCDNALPGEMELQLLVSAARVGRASLPGEMELQLLDSVRREEMELLDSVRRERPFYCLIPLPRVLDENASKILRLYSRVLLEYQTDSPVGVLALLLLSRRRPSVLLELAKRWDTS